MFQSRTIWMARRISRSWRGISTIVSLCFAPHHTSGPAARDLQFRSPCPSLQKFHTNTLPPRECLNDGCQLPDLVILAHQFLVMHLEDHCNTGSCVIHPRSTVHILTGGSMSNLGLGILRDEAIHKDYRVLPVTTADCSCTLKGKPPCSKSSRQGEVFW